MKNKVLYLFIVINYLIWPLNAQNVCNHDSLIMSFLLKITSPNYKPRLVDYNDFFDINSELEIAFRSSYVNDTQEFRLTNDTNSRSLTIEKILCHSSFKYFIEKIKKNNCKWIIIKHYMRSNSTIIYEVGIDCSTDFIRIQVTDWAYKNRCGINDIFDSNNNSFFKKPG